MRRNSEWLDSRILAQLETRLLRLDSIVLNARLH